MEASVPPTGRELGWPLGNRAGESRPEMTDSSPCSSRWRSSFLTTCRSVSKTSGVTPSSGRASRAVSRASKAGKDSFAPREWYVVTSQLVLAFQRAAPAISSRSFTGCFLSCTARKVRCSTRWASPSFPGGSLVPPTSTTLTTATSGRLGSRSTSTRMPDGRSTLRTSKRTSRTSSLVGTSNPRAVPASARTRTATIPLPIAPPSSAKEWRRGSSLRDLLGGRHEEARQGLTEEGFQRPRGGAQVAVATVQQCHLALHPALPHLHHLEAPPGPLPGHDRRQQRDAQPPLHHPPHRLRIVRLQHDVQRLARRLTGRLQRPRPGHV